MLENENGLTITKHFNDKYEKVTASDMLAALRYLEAKIQSGECVGIAFAAICQGGRAARGYAGAVKEHPEMTMGTLSALSYDILEETRDTKEKVTIL